MAHLFHALSTRLALAFSLLLLLLGAAFISLIHWSNERYYQEITQRLNQSLAMYIVQREPLIQAGQVNQAAIKTLADLVMVVNPIVEVYLLDTSGNILAHALPPNSLKRTRIDLTPIKTWLAAASPSPVLAQDPRSEHGERVFSAFAVEDQGQTAGYLYVVLGGQQFQSLRQSLQTSYILQQSLAGLLALTLFALASAVVISRVLTKPLRQIAQAMQDFHQHELQPSPNPVPRESDLAHVARTFAAMRQRINEQLQHLQDSDQLRRELISNVSHDLRTPLSAMQGYLDILRKPSLSEDERRNYLAIASKHCRRLGQLVKELFELSKLDAGRTELQWEQFAMAELLQDVMQKFSLAAQQKSVTLIAEHGDQAFPVRADIALIERVLENLIDNALRYTPPGGQITLQLAERNHQVEIAIKDNGAGLAPQDLPFIFERYYVGQPAAQEPPGTGLGLAIVKRILALHHSDIQVASLPHKGTCFWFCLPSNNLPTGVAAQPLASL